MQAILRLEGGSAKGGRPSCFSSELIVLICSTVGAWIGLSLSSQSALWSFFQLDVALLGSSYPAALGPRAPPPLLAA